MEDLHNFPAISALLPEDDPRHWLAQYLRTRGGLASYKSDFYCDPACTRPGCRNPDLQVQVSIIDLLGAALHRGEQVAANFQERYSLGLFANGREDLIRMVALKLQKPCPFLEGDLCGIYPVRPLPCALFPEYLACGDKFGTHPRPEHLRDYLCFHRPLNVSPDRAKIVAKIQRLWERESIISSYYLFNHGACYLDFGNLAGELLEEAGRLLAGESGQSTEPPGFIPHRVLEHFFLEHIAQCRPFAGVNEKIDHLNRMDGQLQVLQLLQNDRLLRKLQERGDDRALVFRFVKGKLRPQRRSLLPTEYRFY